jgi:hypothetical protein
VDCSFGTTKATEKGHEIRPLECEEYVLVRVTYDSGQGIGEVQIRFSGCTGG